MRRDSHTIQRKEKKANESEILKVCNVTLFLTLVTLFFSGSCLGLFVPWSPLPLDSGRVIKELSQFMGGRMEEDGGPDDDDDDNDNRQ